MERRDPLWEDILVHRSCQVWSRRTFLRMMILYTQKFYCKEKENELKKFSQQDRLSKLGTDAEFLAAVEVGQYFMTRDTEEFSQMTDSVACREYTMPRDAEASEPKGWIRGNTKIGPVLEVTTCCLQGKYGVEIIVKSVNRQFSLNWSEFLMAWKNWSQTWTTRTKTTTSRKPQKCSSKNMR